MRDRPPGKRSGPDTTPGRSHKHSTAADEVGSTVQRDPVPLAAVIDGLLDYSNVMDASLRLRLAAYRQGHADGRELGWREGYAAAVTEQERSWRAIAAPVAHSGELQRRRWGPGGREHFADPRPGDYPGLLGGDAA